MSKAITPIKPPIATGSLSAMTSISQYNMTRPFLTRQETQKACRGIAAQLTGSTADLTREKRNRTEGDQENGAWKLGGEGYRCPVKRN